MMKVKKVSIKVPKKFVKTGVKGAVIKKDGDKKVIIKKTKKVILPKKTSSTGESPSKEGFNYKYKAGFN